MKMEVVFVVVAIMLIMVPIRVSSAQDEDQNVGCWVKFTDCLQNDGALGCCSIIRQQIDDERDCFCLMKPTIVQNATVASSFSTIFTVCGISDTFESLCPDGSDASSAPVEPPSPSTTTPTTEIPPSPSSPATEQSEDAACWSKITKCTELTSSSSEILECCPILKQEIRKERECFCAAKDIVLEDPSDADAFDQFLTLCNVPDSFDTLCPGTTNSTGNEIRDKSARSTSSSTSKIAYSVGILPISFLIICWISVLVS